MRTFFVVIGMFFALGMASASAGVVTSVGGTVLSGAGEPVTNGGAIIEQSEGSYLDVTPAKPAVTEERTCERTITEHKSFVSGLVHGLPQKGYSYTAKNTWTKTVTHTKTVEVSPAEPAKSKRVRNNRSTNGNRSAGGKDNSDGGARGRP